MISSLLTFLLLLSTMICGFWMKANNVTDLKFIRISYKLWDFPPDRFG